MTDPPPPPAEGAGGGPPADGPAGPPTARVRRRLPKTGRVLIVLGPILLVVGLSLVGSVIGSGILVRSRPRSPAPNQLQLTEDAALSDPQAAVTDNQMPDLIGLTESEAREALLDIGLGPSVVAVEQKPYAGQAARVITQQPVRRTPNPAKATVVLSTAVAMPNLRGVPIDTARRTLGDLGVQVLEQRVYDAAVPQDQVVATEPAAGMPLSDTRATVRVSSPPESIFLSSLDAVESDCSKSKVVVNGTPFDEALTCSVYQGSASTNDYAVGRHADRLEATVGIDDTSDPRCAARFTVLADGAPVANVEARFGAPKPLNVTVTGRLRVAIVATSLVQTDRSCSAVWANARLVAARAGIEALTVKP